jgi:type II secretory ATPase GspE/PulE/Tfp pilus assembly ATPase PilB-like protein
LLASLAQRLVRTICSECKTDYYAPKAVLTELGLDENRRVRFSRGKGCSSCYDSGFKGRAAIYEILQMDAGLQGLILQNPTIDALQQYLKKDGHISLRENGYAKVLEGTTTLEEVQRVTSVEM